MLQKLFGSEDDGKLKPGEEELIGTRFFDEEDFYKVPHWVQDQIHKICNKGLGESPEELTHELVGKNFIYRLEFDGPSGEILGVYRILKGKAAPSKKTASHPQWEVIGRKNYGEVSFNKVPAWVQKQITHIYKHGPGSSLGELTYQLKGKRYRYKLEFAGQGGPILVVSRKPRTWYWKKLNG